MTLAPRNAEDSCLKNHHVTDIDPRVSIGPRGTGSSSESCLEKNASDKHADAPEREPQAVAAEDQLSSARLRRCSTALDYPEGGLEAWLVVFGSFCAMFSVYGLINTAAVFESYFSDNQLSEYSSSQLGWIFSLYLFLVFFIGIQVGPVFDRHGPRALVAIGSLLIVASLLLLGLCQQYWQILLTYSVLGGVGGALLNSPAYGAIAHFFDVRRGFATGVATTAGGFGGIVFPILLQYLLPRLGFAWSTRILGLILLGLAVPANLFIHTRLPPRRGPDGAPVHGSVWPGLDLFRDPRFSLCAAGIFFMEFGLFVPLTFIVSYAASHGQDATDSYVLLSLLNAGSVVGRFVPGVFADRIGRFNVIIVTISLCTGTTLGLWLPAGSSRALIIVFAVLFGFASGSNLGLVPVCLGQLCDPRDYARFYSTALMLASFGTLTSVPIGGALLGIGGEVGWTALVVFSGLSYGLALVCYTSARVLAVGWTLRAKF